LAKRLGLEKLRAEILPVTFGFPFGLSVFFPPNIPLPSKIVTQVLDPIDVVTEFGENPDVEAVDAHIREVMQDALDKLANNRRFPILG
jgi:1-acyl-sn-glycerol-3-phosphate acyltransferase